MSNAPSLPIMSKPQLPVTPKVWWRDAAKTVGLTLLLAFGIRTFVAEARWIPTGSMEPTLQVNDRLIIDKVTYQIRDPQRGDIIVFDPPQILRQQRNDKGESIYKQTLIKRVIGVSGDRLELQEGDIYRNGVRLQESYVAHKAKTSVQICAEPVAQSFLALPQVVPPDHYLVLGDNRLNSHDGRCWGLVPRSDLVGRAFLRYWPVNRIGQLD